MKHRVVIVQDMFVVGMRKRISFETINQETANLARQFMPRRHEITCRKGTHTFSIQNYNSFDFNKLQPQRRFEKWVAVEVEHLEHIPDEMEGYILKGGTYLVVDFKGPMSEFVSLWRFIHGNWLPNSEFKLDNRAHFEKLPESYKPLSTENEEEIWIPVV